MNKVRWKLLVWAIFHFLSCFDEHLHLLQRSFHHARLQIFFLTGCVNKARLWCQQPNVLNAGVYNTTKINLWNANSIPIWIRCFSTVRFISSCCNFWSSGVFAFTAAICCWTISCASRPLFATQSCKVAYCFFLDLDATNIWWYVCWWQIITVFAKLHNTRGMRSTSVWFMLVTTCSTNVGAVVVAILVRWIQILHWSKMLNSCCKNASTSRNKYCTYTIHEYHLVSYLCIMLRTSSCILQIKSNK